LEERASPHADESREVLLEELDANDSVLPLLYSGARNPADLWDGRKQVLLEERDSPHEDESKEVVLEDLDAKVSALHLLCTKPC
jgi:hypothetical protein